MADFFPCWLYDWLHSLATVGSALMAVWSKVLPLSAISCLRVSPLLGFVIPGRACEEVASDFGVGYSTFLHRIQLASYDAYMAEKLTIIQIPKFPVRGPHAR